MIRLILGLLLPLLIGLIYVSCISPKKDRLFLLEFLVLGYLVGTGILTLEMLLLGSINIKLSATNIIIASIISISYPVYYLIRSKSFSLSMPDLSFINKLKWFEWPFLFLIIARISFVIFECLIKPLYGCDSFANWGLRAKVFFYEQSLVLNPSNGLRSFIGGGGQSYYPINIPLIESWLFNALGAWDDGIIKIIFALFFISLLVVFYYSVRRFTTRIISLIATYMLSSLPLLVYHSTIEYSDFPLCVYFSSSFFYLINYFRSKDRKHLYISALLAGIGAWTKSEGFQFMLIESFILWVYLYMEHRKEIMSYALDIISFVSIALIFKLPWEVVNIVFRFPRSIWQKIEYDKAIDNLSRIPVIVDHVYDKLLFYGNWNIAWFLFIITFLIFLIKRLYNTRGIYSMLIIVLLLSAISFIYYITPSYVWLLDGTTLNRNVMVVMPIVIYFIAVQISCLFNISKEDLN